jgi:2-polyprenyl-3-methyl-5-hydroxy-6-metoxy-1,4-benzoquinol methylase
MIAADEIDNIRERYRRRDQAQGALPAGSLFQVYRCMVHQEKERAFLKILSRFGYAAIQSKTVLEIGAGFGADILQFLRWGFLPENITVNDCLPDRCAHARKILPIGIRVIEANALDLDLPEGSFDIVLVSTVFTSILDSEFQERLATKIWVLVKPGGAVLWYDFIFDNPANPDVKGMPRRRVLELFPQAKVSMRKITLAPPIARAVCRFHPGLYSAFNLFSSLRTHLVGWLEKSLGKPAAGEAPPCGAWPPRGREGKRSD